ncbi:DUF4748 domain-containing protein [Latimeria chalumnae]|uniref:DUF4748 domain-containing protein n=1 Tax=Latimeria chalumnae TaxID=7897 RepID=UPI0006D8D8BC|nr:PREDICTED: probable hydrolase PNKD [Latimeria chalumnae]|eukprot:XP_014351487.1 PREDICTED: probable hydrolase PNKD [Latimeria chalumnae]
MAAPYFRMITSAGLRGIFCTILKHTKQPDVVLKPALYPNASSFHCSCSGLPGLWAKAELGRSSPEGPVYIPQKRAKNPMKIVGVAWAVGLPSGIILFLLAKREVDKNRLKQLKIRQRMKMANQGKYDSERYGHKGNQAEGLAEDRS